MKSKFAKLIDVKSIITLILIGVLAVLLVWGKPLDEKMFDLFSDVVLMVITYFFSKKSSSDTNTNG